MVAIRLNLILLLCLTVAACGMAGNMKYRTIQIKNSKIGVQFVPRQITRVLEDQLNYQRMVASEFVPQYGDREDNSREKETALLIDSIVDFRMVFRSLDLPDLQVQVRIVKSTGTINIGVVELGSSTLSPAGEAKTRELVDTFSNLYGPGNVKFRG